MVAPPTFGPVSPPDRLNKLSDIPRPPPSSSRENQQILIVRGLNVIISGFLRIMDSAIDDDIKVVFGHRVRLMRKRKGLSQEQLAFRCGLDRTYVGGVERGERNISIVNVEKIARALDACVKDFFSREVESP